MGRRLGHIDFAFRLLVAAAGIWLAIDACQDGGLITPWLAAKTGLLALRLRWVW